MKIEVKTKKKPAAPSVKTMGIKKKATTSPGVDRKKAAITKVVKKAAAEDVKKAITKEVKKAATTKEIKDKKVKIAKKETIDASEEKKVQVADTISAVKAEPKTNQKENDGEAAKKKRVRKRRANKQKAKIENKDSEEKESNGATEAKNKKAPQKRKPSEAEDKSGNENSASLAKKNKTEEDTEMIVKGKLFNIFCKRRNELRARSLFVMMNEFNVSIATDPPPIFKSALRYKICGTKGLINLEYKSPQEAKEMKAVLQKNSLIKNVRLVAAKGKLKKQFSSISVHPRKLSIENLSPGVTQGELKKLFPTALSAFVHKKEGKAKLIFKTKKDAAKAFEEAEDIEINGVKLIVLYCKAPKKLPEKLKAKKKRGKKKKQNTKENDKDGKDNAEKENKKETVEESAKQANKGDSPELPKEAKKGELAKQANNESAKQIVKSNGDSSKKKKTQGKKK